MSLTQDVYRAVALRKPREALVHFSYAVSRCLAAQEVVGSASIQLPCKHTRLGERRGQLLNDDCCDAATKDGYPELSRGTAWNASSSISRRPSNGVASTRNRGES